MKMKTKYTRKHKISLILFKTHPTVHFQLYNIYCTIHIHFNNVIYSNN